MAIDSLRLQNFRSYSDESFEFEPGVNIVVGPNASGKTNLLEAVLLLARGGSFRARDTDLIKHGKPWARLEGFFGAQPRIAKLERAGEQVDKSFTLDGKGYKRMLFERTLPVVFFEPNHLQMLTRGPDQRREFFDDLLERTELGYKQNLAAYRRTLAQRNALLKQNRANAGQQLFAWDIRLAELAEKLARSRTRLIDEVNQDISKNYSRIAGRKSVVNASYKHHFQPASYSSGMLAKLESTHQIDFERGFTAYGPHREDIAFDLGGQPIGVTASRGEVRSVLLALKIFELGLVEAVRQTKPIFLLDDVFSELDGARRRALVKYLKKYQVIITTTDADAVIGYFAEQHKILPL